MTSLSLTARPSLLFNSPGWARCVGVSGAVLIALSRLLETYAVMWAIGALAALYLLFYGSSIERITLLVLISICSLLPEDQAYLGLRIAAFIAMFMLYTRYLLVSVVAIFIVFVSGLLFSFILYGKYNTLFVLTPTVLLLLLVLQIQYEAMAARSQVSPWQRLKMVSLQAFALIFPLLGSGSRAALFVWVLHTIRRLSPAILIPSLFIGAALISLPGLPIFNDTGANLEVIERLGYSVQELVDPAPKQRINMRAVEGRIFFEWLDAASARELFIGSNKTIYLSGRFLGLPDDPPFVPHNALFGLFFQFGFVGLVTVLLYMVSVWRYMASFRPGRELFFMLMIPGFIVLGGFVTPDFALIAGAVNGCIMRYPGKR